MKLGAFSGVVNHYEDNPGGWLRQAIRKGTNCDNCNGLLRQLESLDDDEKQQLMMIVIQHMVKNYGKNERVDIDSGEWVYFFEDAQEGGGKRKSKRTKRMARRSLRRTRRKRGGELFEGGEDCDDDNDCEDGEKCENGYCIDAGQDGGRRKRRRKSRRRSKGGIRWGISWGSRKPGQSCKQLVSGSQCTSGHKCMGEKGNRTCQASSDSYGLRMAATNKIVKTMGYEEGGGRKKSRRRKKRRKRKRTKKKRRRRRRK